MENHDTAMLLTVKAIVNNQIDFSASETESDTNARILLEAEQIENYYNSICKALDSKSTTFGGQYA